MLLIGKTALARGLPMDLYAFPTWAYQIIARSAPKSIAAWSMPFVRTGSGFDQRDMSSAKPVGLMQVTPVAGRDTARRFGVSYDWKRLVSDPVYNTQMGAAEAPH